MFRNPLLDADSINQRSSIFHFFQQSNLSFSFDVQQLNIMREYLDAGTGKSAFATISSMLTQKLLSKLTRDERYKEIGAGAAGHHRYFESRPWYPGSITKTTKPAAQSHQPTSPAAFRQTAGKIA